MIDSQELVDKCYSGSIKLCLDYAYKLYSDYGDYLLTNTQVSIALQELQESAEILSSHMELMGMGTICKKCSEQKSGGCCSIYMAGETDSIQLLINMLVKVDVRMVGRDNVQCCYLGSGGCIFIFKPFFCLNYNCLEITGSGREKNKMVLTRLTGRLLGQQYDLEKMIIAKITTMKNS